MGGTLPGCFTFFEEYSKGISFCFIPTLTEDLWQALAESVCLLTSIGAEFVFKQTFLL